MNRILMALAVVGALAACDGNPFVDDTNGNGGNGGGGDGGGGDGGGDSGGVGGGGLPPGTTDPTASGGIARFEAEGQVTEATYDAATDTIFIDNLPFDGDGTYDRDDVVGTLNGFSVYENNNTTERRAYKALFGQSASGNSQVVIVRTGSYQGFGFGGFVYQRDVGVTLPTTGQATYAGPYAGVRVFQDMGGLEFTTGDAELIVDFEDFNTTDAVEGFITNRQTYNQAGTPLMALPTLIFSTGAITEAGEITGVASSDIFDAGSGEIVPFEAGTYYAVLSDNVDAAGNLIEAVDEIVGVVVVTGTDPNTEITHQETGGFLLGKLP